MEFYRKSEDAEFGFVYIFDGKCGTPIYIGSSKDVRKRLKTHLSLKGNAFRDKHDLERVSCIRISYVGTLETARRVESGLINKYNPLMNSAPGIFPYNRAETDDDYNWLSFTINDFIADDTIVNRVFLMGPCVKSSPITNKADKETSDALQAELDAFQRDADYYRKELDACQRDASLTNAELKERRKRIAELEAENKNLEDKVFELKAKTNSMAAEIFLLNGDKKRNEDSAEFWKKECDFYKEMYDSERAFLHEFMEKYQDFLKRIPIPLPPAPKKRRRLFGIAS